MSVEHNGRIIAAAALALAAAPAWADEGMWTFDAFPAAAMRKAHGFAPDQAWLDRVRGASVRLTGGCSASVVSGAGLVLTNHHCVIDCAQALSTPAKDLIKNGFVTQARGDEKLCPGQQAEIVTSIADVTARVQGAIGTATGAALTKARDAAIAAIEDAGASDKTTTRAQVVTLFGGGQYKLYTYRKYSDVRLVFAPDYQAAQFGGDTDNFNFPRYDVDAAFLRLYEGGKPVATPTHLKWNPRAPVPGEVIFVAGNPGGTQRLFTQSQMAARRDLTLPTVLLLLSEERGRLIGAMAGDAEHTRTGADALFGVENSYKALLGRHRSLLDAPFAAKLAVAERSLRARVAADAKLKAEIGDPWAEVDAATQVYRDNYFRFYFLEGNGGGGSELYRSAVTIVRAAQERAKPDANRLPEYNEAKLPLVRKQLTDARPVYPWLEELEVGFWLSKTREYLTVDDAAVKALLGPASPETLAKRLIAGTKLADPALRTSLYDGGLAAVRSSDDPLIRFVLANDANARVALDTYRNRVEAPILAAQSRLARARFAIYGNTLYPDATFTLRLSYGTVAGWTENGAPVPATTRLAGLFDRATGEVPYLLEPAWLAAKPKLDLATPLNFATTNDIIGGNSGSPAIARDGSVIGAIFDGNIHSLGGNFGYDGATNRSVAVTTAAVEQELTSVYPSPALLAELRGTK